MTSKIYREVTDLVAGKDVVNLLDLIVILEAHPHDEGIFEDQDTYDDWCELRDFIDEVRYYNEDGTTLIRDDYFVDYAKELAEETTCGLDLTAWPTSCIDWKRAAKALSYNYNMVELFRRSFWIESY